MRLLFDTSLADSSLVALTDQEGARELGSLLWTRRQGGSALLLKGARELLEQQSADLDQVTGIVLNRGPGSYTGLRVGFALALGLHQARGLPVAAVPAWEAYALKHRHDRSPLVVCWNARRRGFAFLAYPSGATRPVTASSEEEKRTTGAGMNDHVELGPERVIIRLAPAAALPALVPRPCRIVGPGVESLHQALADALPDDLDLVAGTGRPDTIVLARLGVRMLTGEQESDPTDIEPYYLGTLGPLPESRSDSAPAVEAG